MVKAEIVVPTIIMVTTFTFRVMAAMSGTKTTMMSGFRPAIHSYRALTASGKARNT